MEASLLSYGCASLQLAVHALLKLPLCFLLRLQGLETPLNSSRHLTPSISMQADYVCSIKVHHVTAHLLLQPGDFLPFSISYQPGKEVLLLCAALPWR